MLNRCLCDGLANHPLTCTTQDSSSRCRFTEKREARGHSERAARRREGSRKSSYTFDNKRWSASQWSPFQYHTQNSSKTLLASCNLLKRKHNRAFMPIIWQLIVFGEGMIVCMIDEQRNHSEAWRREHRNTGLLFCRWYWIITCHEWSNVAGRIRGKVDLICQDTKPSKKIK